MKIQKRNILIAVTGVLLAVSIPVLLFFAGIQSSRYKNLLDEVEKFERDQVKIIDENKKLITDISLLTSSERIEKIAREDLGMRQAATEEIVRVEMKDRAK